MATDHEILQTAASAIENILQSIGEAHGVTLALRPNVPQLYEIALNHIGARVVDPITIGVAIIARKEQVEPAREKSKHRLSRRKRIESAQTISEM